MIIRAAAPSDLPRLAPLAQEFYAASRFLTRFEIERFTAAWTQLLADGTGAVFLLDVDGAIAGTIGGVIYPDLYSGELIATEFFWFVTAAARGGGLRLYQRFEQWAREQGAAQIRMVHLADSMPDKLRRFYEKRGYEAAEVHYVRSLK